MAGSPDRLRPGVTPKDLRRRNLLKVGGVVAVLAALGGAARAESDSSSKPHYSPRAGEGTPAKNLPVVLKTDKVESQPPFRYVFRPLYLDGKGGLTYEKKGDMQPFCAEIVPESSPPNPDSLLCSTPARTVEEWLKNPTFPGQLVPMAQGTTVESYPVYESKSNDWTFNPNEAKDPKNPTCRLVRWPANRGDTPPTQTPICR